MPKRSSNSVVWAASVMRIFSHRRYSHRNQRSAASPPYHDLVEIAAAYLFYICNNHPFLDGNKRTAMMAAIVFLRINGIELLPDSAEWEKLMLDVASSKINRDETTRRLRKLLKKSRRS